MRFIKLNLFVIVLILAQLNANGQLFDDFSDGDFTNNPTWVGSESLFVVDNEVLRSNSPTAADYYLSTPNEIMDEARWEFFINLDFSPTGANYVDMYLVADNSDLTTVQNGYFLRFGGTPKEISLYKRLNGSNSIIIDGEDNVLSSSNNKFNLEITRSPDGFWNVMYDKNQTGTFVSGGSVLDNAITMTSHFGIYIKQSSAATPVNSHYFDNFIIEVIPPDLTPPAITGGIASSSAELQISFSEPLDQASAENTGNYEVTGSSLNVISAELQSGDPTKVDLTLSDPIQNGETITLAITNVEDLAGNAMNTETIDIFYFIADVAESKDLVFNEIMADPSPSVGLPEQEYIEIFNASDKIFDMKNWVLVNTTTSKTLTSAVIFPGEYLILCHADYVPLFEEFGTVIGIPSFVVLANTADSLTLINPQGDIIDIVSYKDSWYNDSDKANGGYSLELINPYTPCSGKTNWSASNDIIGGTPGSQNSIFDDTPDTTPPLVESFQIINPQLLQINFNESMDVNSLQSGVYLWNMGVQNVSASPLSNTMGVQLSLNIPLEIGNEYILQISDVTDCIGNPIVENTEIKILIGAQPEKYDILISEIMVDPTPSVGLPEGEYFELYNASDKPLEMQGLKLNTKSFVNPRIILPGEYVLCIDANLEEEFSGYENPYLITGLGLTYFTNGGRDLSLFNASNEEIDRVNYHMSWYKDVAKQDGGYSLERINLAEPCRAGDNWSASIDPSGGTPEMINSVNDDTPDTTPPAATNIYVNDATYLELLFSEPLDELSLLTAIVTIQPELPILDISMIEPGLISVGITLGAPLENGVFYTLTVSGFADCMGNINSEEEVLNFGLPQIAEVGDILINEVLFNPRTGGAEFVEIVNVSDKVIGLQDWAIQNKSGTTKAISTKPVIIFPAEYIVFTDNAQNINQEYPFGKPENYFQMESTPAFNNTSGSVVILNPQAQEMDRLDYLESYHFALLKSFKGVSLERISFTRPTNDERNWTSAAEKVGFATPGYKNSQYNKDGTARTRFEFENEVFSPDNDGFEDQLILNYSMEAPGYVATIEIYDRRGRLQKTLENNTLLATSGTISWDGVTDEGIKARIGPHIYVIHLFNLDGETDVIKLPCIVAGRLSN